MRLLLAVLMLSATAAGAAEPIQDHPEWDAEYTRLIREATTGPQFATPLIDHLPAAPGIPTPLEVNGYIAGAPGHLSYASQIHAYMRALAAASPRVEALSIGPTEEGREMIAVVVADEETIAALDRYRDITRRLADPRVIGEDEAQSLIARGKPIYYLTGGLHSPETGSPEMLMELAYRLAVEDTPLIKSIRSNVITLITPVLEVDGRERMVDTWRWHQAHPDEGALPLIYWGRYVVHDNNRDAVGLALDLSRNIERLYFGWHPQVMHDLHESIPFLYISTGTGPYNAWLDPLMIDQWERMASNEVQRLTAMGLPGVWTHGFYDGWGPSYLFWIAMGHNSLGRFYETFGNALPTTEDRVVRGMSDRDWYRPNPPLPQVRWSLRNNVNYQQSGVLTALAWTAEHRAEVLEQFWRLGQRSVAKATEEGPAAYVFPSDQPRLGQLRDLLALLTEHGIEVSVVEKTLTLKNEWPPPKDEGAEDTAEGDAEAGPGDEGGPHTRRKAEKKEKDEKPAEQKLSFPAGSFIVRMDQPYSRFADTLLDTQYVRGSDRLYDDAGWTAGLTHNLQWERVVNREVLEAPMHRWQGGTLLPAKERPKLDGAAVLAIAAQADTDLVRLRFALPELAMRVTEEEVKGTPSLAAGTVLVTLDDTDRERVARALAGLDLEVRPLASAPEVSSHALTAPRIALLHSWLDTESEGWFRLALEDLGVPYDYISTQDVAAEPDLGGRWDVIIFPPAGGDPVTLVNGLPPGPPLPWKKSELTPNLGAVDSTDDMRPELGIPGVGHLARFVEGGGLLITVGDTARWAVEYGLARYVSVVDTAKVRVDGSLLRAEFSADPGPVAMGYGDSVPVYFARGPAFKVGVMPRRQQDEERPSGRGGKDDPDVPQGRPYVLPPPEPTPAPGEKGFQLPENLPYFFKTYLPEPKDRPRVILAFPEKPGEILLSGMLEDGKELAGTAVVVDSPLGEGHILLFGNNPMWRSTTQGTYSLVMNAVMNHDHLGLGWPPEAKTKEEAE